MEGNYPMCQALQRRRFWYKSYSRVEVCRQIIPGSTEKQQSQGSLGMKEEPREGCGCIPVAGPRWKGHGERVEKGLSSQSGTKIQGQCPQVQLNLHPGRQGDGHFGQGHVQTLSTPGQGKERSQEWQQEMGRHKTVLLVQSPSEGHCTQQLQGWLPSTAKLISSQIIIKDKPQLQYQHRHSFSGYEREEPREKMVLVQHSCNHCS